MFPPEKQNIVIYLYTYLYIYAQPFVYIYKIEGNTRRKKKQDNFRRFCDVCFLKTAININVRILKTTKRL